MTPTLLKQLNASRINYFASPSFWVCAATDENYEILKTNNVPFSINSFVANNGERVTRFEF